MKLTLLVIVLGLCVALLVIAIANGFTPKQTETEPPDCEGISTGLVDFTLYDAIQENKVNFHCKVIAFQQEEVPQHLKDAVAARYILTEPWIISKDEKSEDTAEIQANSAVLDRSERSIRGKQYTTLNAEMIGNVRIEGRGRNFLNLHGESVSMDNERKTFSSDRLVVVSDRQDERMLIKGVGMGGMIDGKGMSFYKDVMAYFAGSNFSGSPQQESDAEIRDRKEQRTTKITCDGSMELRRFDDFRAIGKFVAAFEALRAALGEDVGEQALIDALAYYQDALALQRLAFDDPEAPAVIESECANALPHLKTAPTPTTIKQIGATLGLLNRLCGRIDAKEYAALKRLARDLAQGNNDLGVALDADVSLIVITFNRNVIAVTRTFVFTHISELAKDDAETGLYREPYIDSWQRCEKLNVYLVRNSGSADDPAQDTIEPVKIEMLGGDDKVYMKSYSPVASGKAENRLNSLRECREVHLMLESADKAGGGNSQISQKEIRMLGDVRLHMMGDDAANRRLYEARGAALYWRRPTENEPETGRSELIGSPDEPLMISYSSIAAPELDAKGQHSVIGRCVEKISMLDLDANRKLVILSKDVQLEMSRAGADAGEPLETLQARDWVELTFDKRQMDRKNGRDTANGQDVFGGVETLEAAGDVRTTGRKGRTRSDMLVYRDEDYEDRPAGIIDLYKITDENRETLRRGRPFGKRNDRPLEAVMYSGSSTDMLDSMRRNETAAKRKDGETLSTFTVKCDEAIRYIEFHDMARSDPVEKIAAISKFFGEVRMERHKSNSRDTAYITAKRSVVMDFVARKNEPVDKSETDGSEKLGRSSRVDLVAMQIVGPAAITETIVGQNDSRIQIAEGDSIVWQGTPQAAATQKVDRTTIIGTGETTPKLTYVIEKPRKQNADGANDERITEETTLYCSHKDGRITITRLGAEKDQNDLLAENAAHVLRREQVNAEGKKPWKTLLQLDADTLKLYMEEIPAGREDSKTNIRLRKFEAEGYVLVGDDSYSARAHKAIWESKYGADVVETTRLIATKDGGPSVTLNRLDDNGRPSRSEMTSTNTMTITKTIYDEEVSPKYASRMTLVVTGNAHITTMGFADIKNRALIEYTEVICDELTVNFKEELRAKTQEDTKGSATIKSIIARGNARYFVYGTVEEGDPYPAKAVLIRKGDGGLINYNAPGSSRPVGEMFGTQDANGNYIRPARRWDYYTPDHKKLDRMIYDEQNYLPVKKSDD